MEPVETALQTLGLSPEESKVYLMCLELGKVTILQLAQHTGIPRATLYLLIRSLTAKRLIAESTVEKKKLLVAAEPHILLQLAKEKLEQLQQSQTLLTQQLPELQALYNSQEKPKVRYYEGVEGIKAIYEDTLNYSEILVHCLSQEASPVMGEYLQQYFKRVVRRMIETKEIVSDSAADTDYQKEYSSARNQIITLPSKYVTNTDYMIYGDKVAFITYRGHRPVGVVIEDREISYFERTKFFIIWEAAQRPHF